MSFGLFLGSQTHGKSLSSSCASKIECSTSRSVQNCETSVREHFQGRGRTALPEGRVAHAGAVSALLRRHGMHSRRVCERRARRALVVAPQCELPARERPAAGQPRGAAALSGPVLLPSQPGVPTATAPGHAGTAPPHHGDRGKAQRCRHTHTRLFALVESWGKDSSMPTTRIRM